MTARPFRALVQQIRPLTPDIREMTLEMVEPSSLSFQAGQSIAVAVPDDTSRSPLLRYFSLASSPRTSTHLTLLLNSQDHGKGSTFLLGHEVGAEVQVFGPYGSFLLQHELDKELLFVGTGTGVAPLWSMIAALLEEASPQRIRLLWGLRSEGDRYYFQELEAWSTQHQNFSYALTLSKPSAAWGGKSGRVTDLLQEFSTVDHLAAYVCGNRAMVNEVTDLLRKKGDCTIYRERHTETL
jgi:CDP-4-dehydro-6-deoxyglucose reductase